MKNKIGIFLAFFYAFSINTFAQQIIETPIYKASINKFGQIKSYIINQSDSVYFCSGNYAGFSFEGINLVQDGSIFSSDKDGIHYQLEYKNEDDCLMAIASVENRSDQVIMPKEGIKLIFGLNTYMEKFPEWNTIYFPTMIRSEKTHFTSYFMTPKGKILAVASPDPIASWCNEYQSENMEVKGKIVSHGLHRIYTTSFYLLHRLPLPPRHPQDLFTLYPNQKKEARFFIKSVESLDKVYPTYHYLTQAPVISADLYTQPVGKSFSGNLWTNQIERIEVRTPRNEIDSLKLFPIGNKQYKWTYTPFSGEGEYTVTVVSRNGKISEMKLYVRPDFRFYLNFARKEALRSKPTTTHHAECFYPLYTYFLAKKYVPSEVEDRLAEQVFDSIFPVLYDKEAGEMRNGKYRIQDAATMAGILADRYQVTGDETDLKNAASLVDYLIRCQRKDGGYYNPAQNVHYTSVIYIAKSIMEVMNEEKKLIQTSKTWGEIYSRHKASVEKAIEDLASRGDNVETEGQMTFEDGMISCSVTQLALAALKTDSQEKRKRYMEQAIRLNRQHQCLTQKLIPDSRMNGATLRFWEYQYTLNLMHNGMNSPCGWSAWKYYGSWYLYLLTGKYEYIREVINGLGASMQLLDINTKELRFGFIPDPFIDAYQFTETPKSSKNPQLNRVIIGEQYLSQISSWHYKDPYAWRKTKFGIDNFVHEVFKCMTEIFIENAYIIEAESGELKGINCQLTQSGEVIHVEYDNPLIKNLHINLKKQYVLNVNNQLYKAKGLKWLIGFPDDLRKL